MGIEVENCQEFRHTTPGRGYFDYRLHAHRQDQNIDTTSASYSQSDHDGFVSAAATSQFAFDGAVTNVLGTWYSGLSSAFKQGFRDLFL